MPGIDEALLLGGGLSALGGLLGGSGAKRAAKQQAKAMQSAIDEQRRQYDMTMANLQPFLEAGLLGQDALLQNLGFIKQNITQQPSQSTLDQLSVLPGELEKAQSELKDINRKIGLATPKKSFKYYPQRDKLLSRINDIQSKIETLTQQSQPVTTPQWEYQGSPFPDLTLPELNLPELTLPELDLPGFDTPTMDELVQDPGYQFRLNQGIKALESSAATKGLVNSSALPGWLQEYAQGLASQEYQNMYNRKKTEYDADIAQQLADYNALVNKRTGEYGSLLKKSAGEYDSSYNKALGEYKAQMGGILSNLDMLKGLMNTGQASATGQAQIGGNISNNISNLMSSIGSVNAAGTAGQYGGFQGALSNIGDMIMLNSFMKNNNSFMPQYPSASPGIPLPNPPQAQWSPI